MLIMPNPNVPNGVWEIAETEEMKEIVGLYGKTYHFWQVDTGDTLPLGKPELMMSFTKDEQVRGAAGQRKESSHCGLADDWNLTGTMGESQ